MTRIGPTGSTSPLRADFHADDLHDRGTLKLREALDNTGSQQHTPPVELESKYDDDFPSPPLFILAGACAAVGFAVGFLLGRL